MGKYETVAALKAGSINCWSVGFYTLNTMGSCTLSAQVCVTDLNYDQRIEFGSSFSGGTVYYHH